MLKSYSLLSVFSTELSWTLNKSAFPRIFPSLPTLHPLQPMTALTRPTPVTEILMAQGQDISKECLDITRCLPHLLLHSASLTPLPVLPAEDPLNK